VTLRLRLLLLTLFLDLWLVKDIIDMLLLQQHRQTQHKTVHLHPLRLLGHDLTRLHLQKRLLLTHNIQNHAQPVLKLLDIMSALL